MKNESAFDGFDMIGFPFTYYDNFSGKCDNCYGKFGFKPFYFILDVLFAMVLGFLVTISKRTFSEK